MNDDAEDLTHRLRLALQAAGHPAAALPLEHLRHQGRDHDHVRLPGSGLLARIPRQSRMGLAAADNLVHLRACFERAAEGGHAPSPQAWLPPSAHLPLGALLLQEIVGRPVRLPADLGAIATALAALHALPLPQARAPLQNPPDPLRALCEDIAAQARHLGSAGLAPRVVRAIETEWHGLQARLDSPARPPVRLIAFHGHPGNFIVQADGRAMLVDLGKCRYAYPGLDLAHATLYTSTTWDAETRAELTPAQVSVFYATWTHATGLAAEGALAWHLPLRRAMWLWSVTRCARWRATSGNAALAAHARERIDHYLSLSVVSWVRDEFATLEHLLA